MPKNKTRSAQGSGTIRKKTVTRNGQPYTYWEARITVGRDPGTGKQIQKSFSGKTQKEVREKMQAAAVAINEGDYFEPTKITLAQWADVWLQDYTADKKYLTVKHYKAQVEAHIKPALGAVKLCSLTTPHIQRFYNDLLKSGHEVRKKDKSGKVVISHLPLSVKSVRNIHGILTKCLNTAVDVGYLKSNPAERTTLPKQQKAEIAPLTDEQIKEFLTLVDKDEYSAILKTILFTGMRESEAIGLTWDCVDFKCGTVKICKQLQKRPKADGGFVFAPLKNSKTRIVKPAPFVLDILKVQEREQTAQRLRAGEAWQGWQSLAERKTGLVFTTADGRNLSPQTLYNHYKKLAVQIGADSSRVHDLRHTFAVLSLQNGDDVKTVQDNLGHATAAFTLDVYGHVSEKMKQDSADRMQQYIASVKG